MKPSPTQLMLLRHLAALPREKQSVTRWPGGFWAPVGTPTKVVLDGMAVPSYYVGTQTVRAMERLGMLKQDLSHSSPEWARPRRLTTAGRYLGRIAGWTGEDQE